MGGKEEDIAMEEAEVPDLGVGEAIPIIEHSEAFLDIVMALMEGIVLNTPSSLSIYISDLSPLITGPNPSRP